MTFSARIRECPGKKGMGFCWKISGRLLAASALHSRILLVLRGSCLLGHFSRCEVPLIGFSR